MQHTEIAITGKQEHQISLKTFICHQPLTLGLISITNAQNTLFVKNVTHLA